MVRPTIVIPTGYEMDQKKAEAKRALAKMMLEKGLQTQPMQNWLQVLGQIGSVAAGHHLEGQADKLDTETNKRILADYIGQTKSFTEDAKVLSPTELVAKYSDKPFLADDLKPYQAAMEAGLKEGQEHTYGPHGWTTKGAIPEGSQKPSDPTDSVIRDPSTGEWKINPVKVTASLLSQAMTIPQNGSYEGTTSMPDPYGKGSPAAMPPIATPEAGGMNLNLLTPEEKQIMAAELQRRAGGQSGGNYTLQNDTHIPMGSPITASRPPAGAVNGKPYWIINGQPFDNPEGR